MQGLSNIDYLREWFRECPALSRDNRFRIDYLSETPTEYALYAVPSTLQYTENVLGEEVLKPIQTLNFIFAAKEAYGADVTRNSENLAFFESVISWIIEQNSHRNLPRINDGRVKSIVPTLTPFPAEIGSDAAKYQIQLRLTYKHC